MRNIFVIAYDRSDMSAVGVRERSHALLKLLLSSTENYELRTLAEKRRYGIRENVDTLLPNEAAQDTQQQAVLVVGETEAATERHRIIGAARKILWPEGNGYPPV